ncbi:MAG TPA: hypothetical protein VKA27_14010 [Sunxiuqinia sp.]|nr:hypothetical protein [Sunxiuqinia sp.]
MNKADNYIFIKILLLAFFLVFLNSWLNFHIDKDFVETYFVGGVLVFFGIVSFFIKYLGKTIEEKMNKFYAKWLSHVLNFQVIGGLYFLFFMIGCFVSSIQISSNKKQTLLPIELMAPGRSDTVISNLEINSREPVAHKTVFTIPFGRTFVLHAKGYQQFNFKVFPWVGKRIVLESDLKVSPTAIIRVPTEFHMQLPRAKISFQHNNQKPKIIGLNSHATIIFGQVPEIPDEYIGKWLNELRGRYSDQTVIFSTLNKWTDDPLFIATDFFIGDSLTLMLLSKENEKFAVCNGKVDANKFKEFNFKSIQK